MSDEDYKKWLLENGVEPADEDSSFSLRGWGRIGGIGVGGIGSATWFIYMVLKFLHAAPPH